MIDSEALSKRYTLGDQAVRALDRVDLHLGQGEKTAIGGPSGAGQSLLEK
jgi:putative ABC transport system ATP-binding protein